ncbi:hypothetical protein ROHU_012788 [Labeo rohita]|uniref:Uncharacterized protein n=1 Tax=Labeo rohita TaxID=84645 RepID=A0A498LI46_LABRO|nr:hypothetical protein ROHU_012788 [Labeo rohita]
MTDINTVDSSATDSIAIVSYTTDTNVADNNAYDSNATKNYTTDSNAIDGTRRFYTSSAVLLQTPLSLTLRPVYPVLK